MNCLSAPFPTEKKLNIFLPAFSLLQSVPTQMAKCFLRPCTACSTEVNGNPDTDFSNRKIESTNKKKARKMKSLFFFLLLQKNNLKRIRIVAKWRNQKHFKLLPMTLLTTVMLIPREQHCCGITLKSNHIQQKFHTNICKTLFSSRNGLCISKCSKACWAKGALE